MKKTKIIIIQALFLALLSMYSMQMKAQAMRMKGQSIQTESQNRPPPPNPVPLPCGYFNCSYDDPSIWTRVLTMDGSGLGFKCRSYLQYKYTPIQSDISNGVFDFKGSRGGIENRVYTQIPPLSNSSWSAQFAFTFIPEARNTCPAHILAGFTSTTMDCYNIPITAPQDGINCCDGGANFPPSNQNIIAVSFGAEGQYLSDKLMPSNWVVNALSKSAGASGPVWQAPSKGIHISVAGTYYIRVQRLSSTQGVINVFQNADYTGDLPGSPQCFSISANCTGLQYLQHGNCPQGGDFRELSGLIDNMCVSATAPVISGSDVAYCSNYTLSNTYTYTISGTVGATFSKSYWGVSGGTIVGYIPNSTNPTGIIVAFPIGVASAQIYCTPVFGSTMTCATYFKTVTINCAPNFNRKKIPTSQANNPELEVHNTLYPNPNNGSFTFNYEVPEGSKANFEIMDLTGRKIASYILHDGENVIDANQNKLEQGIYLYSIVLDGQITQTEKFSVIK